jgi:proton-dependent oligopeptide transporter, POT family
MLGKVMVKTRDRNTAFFGHPIGLGWLSATEFWERFSYYGMQALLVLYMTKQLLLPGHVEHVLGFSGFRGIIESVRGPLPPTALASQIFGLYAGLVYVTPILGGVLADRVIGRDRAVIAGACLMALGHFLMAFDASFLLAMLCLLIGVGCFKGNIATQVGDLYAKNDPRRADAFQMYFFGIQLAGIVTPLVCGTLGQIYGWHWGFGAAGVGMLAGLAVYLIGRPTLAPEPPIRRKGSVARLALTAPEWRNVWVLVALLPVLALSVLGNQQIYNAYLVWGDAHFRLDFFGMNMPVTWFLSLDGIISAGTMAASLLFWRWWGTRWREPDEITKISIGTVIAATGPLLMAVAAATAHGQRVSPAWGAGYQLVNDIGFANVLPVGLALYSRASPKSIAAIMIAVYYLHLFLANYLVGYLGGFVDKMPGTTFWLMHTGLMGASAVILMLVRGAAGRALAPSYDAPHEAAA